MANKPVATVLPAGVATQCLHREEPGAGRQRFPSAGAHATCCAGTGHGTGCSGVTKFTILGSLRPFLPPRPGCVRLNPSAEPFLGTLAPPWASTTPARSGLTLLGIPAWGQLLLTGNKILSLLTCSLQSSQGVPGMGTSPGLGSLQQPCPSITPGPRVPPGQGQRSPPRQHRAQLRGRAGGYYTLRKK